ncbi:Glyco_trans_2-like domain-containing protein [Hyphomicrobiales bacterium]|nr:Glyco_trans_2-like domain-containing protein [Hyphomicrobiales bacterium]CAH1698138.1 Glyco_trans_2-like domain-containing protein [Hyphomicrobiales bacterium]CAI0347781.1 Glyco_trans_2-like domain-containing protein [Hyphomicrobiales bacterium]
MAKVSICIPAYKQVEFLRITLASIADQRFEDYEVIVSDDSPNGDVEELVGEFGFGGRLRYVRNAEALGSPRNWNAALALAQGEYLKILHHDDHFSDPHALGRFVGLLDDNPQALFAFSGTNVENVEDGSRRHHRISDAQAKSLALFPEQLFMGNVIGAPSATIVRRALGIEYDTRMKWLVDLDYYIRALRVRSTFAYTPEPLITTPTSAAHQVTELVRDDAAVDIGEALMLFEKCLDRLKSEPDAQEIWIRLLRKYEIRSADDLARFGRVSVAMQGYFKELYRTPRLRPVRAAMAEMARRTLPRSLFQRLRSAPQTSRHLVRVARNGCIVVIVRLYAYVPLPIKQAWRRFKLSVGK